MAFKNFIPEIWSEAINRDLERLHVFGATTNRKYEGEVSKKGDSVKILGIGSPTVTEVDRDAFTSLSSPEKVQDTSTVMYINHMAYYSYGIDDIDKRQAIGGIMEALAAETSEKLADVQDRHIASLACDKEVTKYSKWANNSANAIELDSNDKLEEVLLGAHQALYENDVKSNTRVSIIVPPAIATMYKKYLIHTDQQNSSHITTGKIGTFDGMDILVSNNVYTTTESGHTVYNIQVKTDRAIAFARPMVHTEAFRPEAGFEDAVKGYILFGSKVVRPKEIINLNVRL